MIINIALCDDEQESLDILKKELEKAAEKLNIKISTSAYDDGNKVLDLICKNKEDFDILFLDIDISHFDFNKICSCWSWILFDSRR